MHGHLNVRRIGVSESVNRCRVNVKGSGDVGNGFAFQNKATCQFTLIQSKLIHQHINMLAATPLWYRNPWSAANSGHCALPRTRSLNLTASRVPLLLKPQNSTPQHQIIQTQRTVPYTPDEVYAAFADP